MMLTRSLSRKLSTIKTSDLKIINNVSSNMLVLQFNTENNEPATVSYEKQKNVYTLIESYIPEIYRGKGYGKILAKKSFDYVVENNGKMIIECEFLQKVYNDNPEPYKKYVVG